MLTRIMSAAFISLGIFATLFLCLYFDGILKDIQETKSDADNEKEEQKKRRKQPCAILGIFCSLFLFAGMCFIFCVYAP